MIFTQPTAEQTRTAQDEALIFAACGNYESHEDLDIWHHRWIVAGVAREVQTSRLNHFSQH